MAGVELILEGGIFDNRMDWWTAMIQPLAASSSDVQWGHRLALMCTIEKQ